MSFFISDAMAQAETAAQPNGLMSLLPLIIIFAIMYFMLIRPQQKRMKAHKEMVGALGKGDEVVTNGGVLGKVTGLDDAFASVEIADNVTIKVQRGAIANVLPKGTIKSIK
jgi:preprotein translocase subunit YajC